MLEPRDPLLQEREKTHGDFSVQGSLAQAMKSLIDHAISKEQKIYGSQREALDMICTKISRICCGDALEKDHWDDIAGYAKLGSEACEP